MHMPTRSNWTRQQLLLAFKLYCRVPFGKFHSTNPDIIKYGKIIGRTPSALAMKLSNIASLDSAITSTGRKGLTGASSADKAMWDEMQTNWGLFVIEIQKAEGSFGITEDIDLETGDNPENKTADYTGTNKTVQTTTRVGQIFFRRSVLSAYNFRCCISGLSIPRLLVASHIIPWSVDEKNRLNPRNGLCLSSLHDKAFDLGIITIADNMTISVSQSMASNEDLFFNSAIMAYEGKPVSSPEKFYPNKEFLAYHREHIFESKNVL